MPLLKIFRRHKLRTKEAQLKRALKGIIVVSPLIWLFINVMLLTIAFLLLPPQLIMSRIVELFQIFIMMNGWFWAGLMFTYLLRDQSHKFISPTFSCSLGRNDGFLTYAPPMIKDNQVIEPQFTIRTGSGFEAMNLYSAGKIIMIYPTKYETHLLSGGISCYSWLRACTVDQIPENARIALVREGVAHGVFADPNTEVWFSRTVFDVGRMAPNREDLAWDVGRDELIAEINRLKAIVQEKDFQIESYELGRSRQAFMLRPEDANFKTHYQTPSRSVGDRARELYEGQEEGFMSEAERRRRWKYP